MGSGNSSDNQAPNRSRTTQRYTLSLLERLQEGPLNSQRSRPPARNEDLKDLIESVRRNLSALFNTRYSSGSVPDEFTCCLDSVLTYGLPDMSSFSPANPEHRDDIRLAVQETIARFEPRLSSVRVLPEPRDPLVPHLRFRVHALLHAGQAYKPISFETVLRADDGLVLITGAQ